MCASVCLCVVRVVCVCLSLAAPMAAIVKAQGEAGIASARFMRSVAFDAQGVSVGLQYLYNDTSSGSDELREISVPALNVLPLPFLKVCVIVCVSTI